MEQRFDLEDTSNITFDNNEVAILILDGEQLFPILNILAQFIERSLTKITAEDLGDITTIRDYAFYKYTNLTEITFPNSITSIGSHAFFECTNLTEITIPSGVTSIGNSVFSGCSGLTEITIPSGVTSIGDWAFGGCSSLKTFNFLSTTPPTLGNNAFEDGAKTINVPSESLTAYQEATNWSAYSDYMVGV